MSDALDRLYVAVLAAKRAGPPGSRTARLLHAGRAKMAKKLAEEAAEVLVDAIRDDRDAVIRESADLLYHLIVLWTSCGVLPKDVWNEMDRRERLLGLAEKPPKARPPSDPPVCPAEARRMRNHR
jgi:phosphoribosyl-ATP pyrophosphohydrolase